MVRPGAMILAAMLAASCAPSTTATLSQPSPTVVAPAATVMATSGAVPVPGFAAAECTTATATTRQVIERYFALSTSNNAQPVIDCFAKVWRDKNDTNPTFAESASRWSQTGPASGLVITLIDTVKGCDRFRVTAQMATYGTNNAFSVPPFFTVGPEAGRVRIFETSTGLVNQQAATTTCS